MTNYPVMITIAPQAEQRNRLTTALRPILAIPHAILAGPVYWSSRTGGVGLLGAAAYVMAIISWFTLLITGQQFRGIRDFSLYYLRWRTRALAYMALFVDPYPPFGDETYPATIEVQEPAQPRDSATIAVRLILVLPHLVVLLFLLLGLAREHRDRLVRDPFHGVLSAVAPSVRPRSDAVGPAGRGLSAPRRRVSPFTLD